MGVQTEYDFSGGVRGKYASRYAAESALPEVASTTDEHHMQASPTATRTARRVDPAYVPSLVALGLVAAVGTLFVLNETLLDWRGPLFDPHPLANALRVTAVIVTAFTPFGLVFALSHSRRPPILFHRGHLKWKLILIPVSLGAIEIGEAAMMLHRHHAAVGGVSVSCHDFYVFVLYDASWSPPPGPIMQIGFGRFNSPAPPPPPDFRTYLVPRGQYGTVRSWLVEVVVIKPYFEWSSGPWPVLLVILLGYWVYIRRARVFIRNPALCASCEYDLRATTTNRCPECGSPISRQQAALLARVFEDEGPQSKTA